MTDEFLVTDDPDELREKLDELEATVFDEVELLSSSPDQRQFVEMKESEIVGRYDRE